MNLIMNKPLISICIPSYNRPNETLRLLNSIYTKFPEKIEIVICEDKSPERTEIRAAVNKFSATSKFEVKYFENETNLGYDKNLKELIKKASGEWIVFMGNDDVFVLGALDKLIEFLEKNSQLGYVLRSYELIYKNGEVEKFRYYNGNKFFEPGDAAYMELFRKSVFISGFTIRRELVLDNLISDFDGMLLFQLYLVGEVTIRYPSAYFDEPLSAQYERVLAPSFGSSASEKGLYTPGEVTIQNSLNFMKGFARISEYLDGKYNIQSSRVIIGDLSKYSYPILSIQRERGIRQFLKYVSELNKLGFNCSLYYYLYVLALLIFNKGICDWLIMKIKQILGKTPKL